jgi:hypothetical protein
MNGRIYDPLLGRFLSADVLVDGAMDLQGYNRYSYVKNNPLTLHDPSGYSSVGGRIRPFTPMTGKGDSSYNPHERIVRNEVSSGLMDRIDPSRNDSSQKRTLVSKFGRHFWYPGKENSHGPGKMRNPVYLSPRLGHEMKVAEAEEAASEVTEAESERVEEAHGTQSYSALALFEFEGLLTRSPIVENEAGVVARIGVEVNLIISDNGFTLNFYSGDDMRADLQELDFITPNKESREYNVGYLVLSLSPGVESELSVFTRGVQHMKSIDHVAVTVMARFSCEDVISGSIGVQRGKANAGASAAKSGPFTLKIHDNQEIRTVFYINLSDRENPFVGDNWRKIE